MAERSPGPARAHRLEPAELPAHVARASELCLERNARDGLVLDLRGLSDATDYFLIAGGDSDVHVRAIAEHILQGLKSDEVQPAGVEGLSSGRWVLIDYIDLVVHIFHPALREFYQLEHLWGDAPIHDLEDGTA